MSVKFSLLIPLLLSGTALAQSTGTFTPTGNMTVARSDHRATLLPNGKVLITGGDVLNAKTDLALSSAELYDPAAGVFATTGDMCVPRVGHSATLLSSGKVLIAGGQDDHFHELSTAELYDPSTGTFTPTGSMTAARTAHTATLLNNGQVLMTGGFTVPAGGRFSVQLESAELYDPATGSFIPTGAMNAARVGHTATLLGNGKVLIVGGTEQFLSAEIYDPADGTFNPVGGVVNAPIWNGATIWCATPDSATLLPNGNVLFTFSCSDDADYLQDTEHISALYSPLTATFSRGADITQGYVRTATLLGDGTVLTAGQNYTFYDSPTLTSHADLYNFAGGTFSATGSLFSGRVFHTATLLPDGTVLLAGGRVPADGLNPPWQCTAAAELYHPAMLTPSPVLYSLPGATQGVIWHAATGYVASPNNPAVAGEVLSMYTSNLIEGAVIPPQVAIGGRLAEVLYFGDAPGYPGYSQVNFRVPAGVASESDVSVRLTYLGRSSNAVTIAVQ
jgi:hypothetical protein